MAGQLKLEDLQSFEDLFAPKQSSPAPTKEQRRSDRKAMEADGALSMDGQRMAIKTIDVSLGGLSLLANRQLGVGMECQIGFPIGREAVPVAANARVIYCFYTGEQNFRAGLEFLQISNGSDALKQYLSG